WRLDVRISKFRVYPFTNHNNVIALMICISPSGPRSLFKSEWIIPDVQTPRRAANNTIRIFEFHDGAVIRGQQKAPSIYTSSCRGKHGLQQDFEFFTGIINQ